MVVTGWQIHALYSAKLAGVPVPDDALVSAARFIDALTNTTTGRTGYRSRPADNDTDPLSIVSTGVSLACRGLLGQNTSSGVCVLQKSLLMSEESLPTVKESWKSAGPRQADPNVYLHFFFASTALASDESSAGREWYKAVSTTIMSMQEKDGGWPIIGKWGYVWGKVHTTALSVLALESTYR
jgi:hypothetical protein